MLEPAFWLFLVEWLVRIGLSLRVIMRREPIGTSLAWLTVVLLLPIAGAVAYLLIGEKRLGFYRARWTRQLDQKYQPWRERLWKYEFVDWGAESDPAQLSRLISGTTHSPPLGGNQLQLMDSATEVFRSMIADINDSTGSCFLEYYIWEAGGLADEIAEALSAAAQRGVDCRILVDAVGSRGFLRSQQAKQLRADGIKIRAALPANLFRALFHRFDLRLHRKIAVFDRKVAYVGSQNMADPKRFQRGAGLGQWIDAMVRVQGPAVDALLLTLYEDWQLDSLGQTTAADIPAELELQPSSGTAPVQVVPSGPGLQPQVIGQALLNAIYMTDHRVVLTSPYFVPDETLQTALISAVRRGAEVIVVVPEKVNSILVRLANRAFLRELVAAGVQVACYQGGMLHTKSVVVDDDTCMFGSLNLDPRSLNLNFEITLMIYDSQFTRSVARLQQQYIAKSRRVELSELQPGSFPVRLLENCVRLLAPLL